ncbi:hypothetical protein BGZ81_003172 [Podila clonocystis]|nr:hypothetical protein BGZ81_003172 [Podila clonocystis]
MQGIRTPSTGSRVGPDSDLGEFTEHARLRDQQPLVSNSLFYTDYENHEWLGYSRACTIAQPQVRDKLRYGNRDSLDPSYLSCDLPQYNSLTSRGAFAPWDENENRPQAASNSSASDRQNHHLFALDPPPFQRGFYRSPISFSVGEKKMPSSFPFNADEMYPKQPSLRHYSHVAQFPISSQTLRSDPRIEAQSLLGVNHSHIDPDIQFRSPVPCPPSPLTVSNNNVSPTRYLRVSNVPRNISKSGARDAFMSFGDLRGVFSAYLESDGKMFLEFYDIRHAMNASARLPSHPVFSSSSVKVSSDILDNDNEGSLSITITRPQFTSNEILNFLMVRGELQFFEAYTQGCSSVIIVDYYDTRHAASVMSMLREMHMNQQISCRVMYHRKDPDLSPGMDSWPLHEPRGSILHQRVSALVDSPVSGSSTTPSPEASLKSNPTTILSDSFASMVLGAAPNLKLSGIHEEKYSGDQRGDVHATIGQLAKTTPSGNKETLTTPADPVPKTSIEENNKVTSNERAMSPGRNAAVQAPRSRSVKDKRTTFMIRNIPNKYTQKMLLECINETHFGKFDFLYLRIDFKNKCNVGYAFINFVNVEVVDSFVAAHVGKKWNRFNSDKICSMAYAEVQGRQALIDKFRNSNVMNEDPSWRPKIFYTSGPNLGLEEPFPKPTISKESFRGPMCRKA